MILIRNFLDRYRPLGWSLLAGGGLTLLATLATLYLELGQQRDRYYNLATHLSERLQTSLTDNYKISQALTAFYNASDRVTNRDFTQFTLFLLQDYPAVSGIAWIERVNQAERAGFQRQNQGISSIFGFNEQQVPITIENRAEYFPLTYGEPLEQFESLLGFDLGSQQQYRLTLEQAIRQDSTVIGEPLTGEKRNFSGFALYHPIYRRNRFTKNAAERRQALTGFIYSDYAWSSLIKKAVLSDSKNKLDFFLVDHEGTERRLLMFYDQVHQRIIDQPDQLEQLQNNSNRLRLPSACQIFLTCQHTLKVADQQWLLMVIPPDNGLSLPWKTLTVMLLGAGLTGWVAYLNLRSQKERQEIQTLIDQKEEELKHIKGNLAQQIELQSAELQAVHRAKNELLSNISHELRTPLNIISGFIQLINRDPKLNDNQRSTLAIISRSGDYLLTVFNDILEMSQIEEGNASIRLSVFNLVNLVTSVRDMMRLKASAKNVRLNLYISEEIPQYVKTDENKIRQILINLLDNAIKFTIQGSITLRVESSGEEWRLEEDDDTDFEDDSSVFLFEIEDTGQGIPPEEWESVFEPFIQGSIGRVPGQGTGLGLYIVRRMIRLMGGDIRIIESVVGRGTLFRFTLPIALPTPRELPSQHLSQRIVGLASNQPEYRILVVDDKSENRQLFTQLLVPLGFHLREAANGEDAIAIWSDWRPHLIFMDTRMPVMDGVRAINYIRDQSQVKQTILIALTAGGIDASQVDQLAIACDDILRKPFNIETVLQKIGYHLHLVYRYEPMESLVLGKENPSLPYPILLKSKELEKMPPDWRNTLFLAASAGDSDQLKSLIQQIPPQHNALANDLTELVDFYQFRYLRELIQNEPNSVPSKS